MADTGISRPCSTPTRNGRPCQVARSPAQSRSPRPQNVQSVPMRPQPMRVHQRRAETGRTDRDARQADSDCHSLVRGRTSRGRGRKSLHETTQVNSCHQTPSLRIGTTGGSLRRHPSMNVTNSAIRSARSCTPSTSSFVSAFIRSTTLRASCTFLSADNLGCPRASSRSPRGEYGLVGPLIEPLDPPRSRSVRPASGM